MSTILLCLASFIVGGVSFLVSAWMANGIEALYFEELERSHLLRREIRRLQREQDADRG